MASNSIGTLTLDLIARIGGFVGGMDQAERKAKKSAKGIKDSADLASQAWGKLGKIAAGALSGLTVGAVFGMVIRETRMMEQEQAQLAAVLRSTGEAAGFNREQLNEMAAGLERVSTVSAGDINQAQTALLAFTGVVGNEFVRAQQAALDMSARTGMAVTQAAETIGRALDVPSKGMAALSRQGFRFSEEQKEIIKYLENTGRAAEAQGIILNALEESYGGAALAARDTFGGALLALQNTVNGLLTGSEGSLDGAKASIEELNTALSDPATAAAVAALVDNLLSGAAAVVKALPFIIDAGDGVVRVFDIAANTLIGLYSTAAMYVQRLAASVLESMALLPDSLGGAGFAARAAEYRFAAAGNLEVAQQAADGIREALEKPLAGTAMAEAARQAAGLNQVKKEGVSIDEAAELAAARAASAAEKAADKAKKIAERNATAIASEITALERAAKVWGMSADEVRIYDLRIKGATESQLEHAQALLDTVAGLEKQKKAQEDYKDLVADLRTDEEQRLETLRAQMAVLDAMSDLDPSERRKQAGRITEGLFEKADAPTFPGVDAGPLGELSKLDDAEKELQKWYDNQLEMLATFRQERSDLNDEWDAREWEIKQQHEESLAAIERSRWRVGLESMDSFLTQIQGLRETDNKKGKQAAKAAAIVQATINAYTAATGAYASASAIPVVGWVLGPVAAAAALAAGLANVSAIQGMAHDGIDSVPQTGTWLLEKGERVTTAGTSAKLDATLSRIQSGMNDQGAGRQGGRGSFTLNQTNNFGAPDNRTGNQVASATARKQRAASARLGS